MTISGLQKLSLVDYPKKLCATVFFAGCNFRCPFCHNAALVLPGREHESISEDDLFSFLQTRRGLLDGVCITGGEPLLRDGLDTLIAAIRDMGFLVKLDTNGSFPEKLRSLVENKAVDYVAMDIKNSPERYGETIGIKDFDISPIEESISILKNGGVPFEFRTTLVREFHTVEDMIKVGRWLDGAPKYYLQTFVDSGDVISGGLSAFTPSEMCTFMNTLAQYFDEIDIRGV